ncbi:MAG: hypothetical protein ABWY78_06330 [Microvirga sp.]
MYKTAREKARFGAALSKVALLTPKKESPDAVLLQLYYAALDDFSIETIEEVADELIRTEESLFSLPPPGRWRAIASTLFELKGQRTVYESPRAIDCDFCQDTGWRLVRKIGQRYVVRCECKTGGQPIDESQGDTTEHSRPLFDLEGEVPPPEEPEDPLARRRREHGNRIVSCACCAQPYRIRQGWRCCAPPQGVASHVWFAQWHTDCPNSSPNATGPRGRRCPLHCQCVRDSQGNFPKPAPGEHVHDWAVRMGFRDEEAPGPGAVRSGVGTSEAEAGETGSSET